MVFPNLPDPEEDQIDKNDLWFDIPVSSSKACQEKLAEEDAVEKELNQKYLTDMKNDPNSLNFGSEFAEITANSSVVSGNTGSTVTLKSSSEKKDKKPIDPSVFVQKPTLGEEVFDSEEQNVPKIKELPDDFDVKKYNNEKEKDKLFKKMNPEAYEDPTKHIYQNKDSIFDNYFADSSFADLIPECPTEIRDGFEKRSLVKKILRPGTGLKMREIYRDMKKLDRGDNQVNRAIDVNRIEKMADKKLDHQNHYSQIDSLGIEIGLKIQFHYAAYFEGETVPFDSTQARGEPWTEILGMKKLLPALENSLMSMRINEKAVVLARYGLCYGETGCGKRIPGKKDCMFKIWFTNCMPMTLLDQFMQLNHAKKVQAIKSGYFKLKKILVILHDQSEKIKKDLYNQEKFREAYKKYKRLISLIEEIPIQNDSDEKEINKYKIRYLTNAALSAMQINRYRQAEDLAAQANEINQTAKNYYIIAKSARLRELYFKAEKNLEKMFEIDPRNQDGLRELEYLKGAKKQESDALKSVYEKCFEPRYDEKLKDDEEKEDDRPPKIGGKKSNSNKNEQPKNYNQMLEEKFGRLNINFKTYVHKFLDDFIKDKNQKSIETDKEKVRTFDEIVYVADCCESLGLQADMHESNLYMIIQKNKV